MSISLLLVCIEVWGGVGVVWGGVGVVGGIVLIALYFVMFISSIVTHTIIITIIHHIIITLPTPTSSPTPTPSSITIIITIIITITDQIFVSKGQYLKRIRYHAKGRAGRMRVRYSHLTV